MNYVACHDNHTLHDKILLAYPKKDAKTRQGYQRFITSMVLLSEGVPFIHMGQEFYRTKNGVENSYKSPDSINQIDWALVDKHQDAIAHFKALVALRKKLYCLRLPNPSSIKQNAFVSCNEHGTCILEVCKENGHTIVIFKNNPKKETISFDEAFKIRYASTNHQGIINQIELDSISTIVLQKKEADHE